MREALIFPFPIGRVRNPDGDGTGRILQGLGRFAAASIVLAVLPERAHAAAVGAADAAALSVGLILLVGAAVIGFGQMIWRRRK